MYTLHRAITSLMLIATPARMIAALPLAIPVMTQANTAQVETAPQKLTLDTSSPQPVVAEIKAPNFDTEVLEPLKATQAEAAAKAAQARAAAKRAKRQASVKPAMAPTGDVWYRLRLCESGSNYQKNTGNGYFGAYQYSLGTWNGFGGYARPDLAPASVQDAKAQADFARRGWSPWPACSRRISA